MKIAVHGRKGSSNSNSSDRAYGHRRLDTRAAAFELGLVMGQHVEIIAMYHDTDTITHFRVRQLGVAGSCFSYAPCNVAGFLVIRAISSMVE